jgi:hypothetical protein
LLAGLSLTSYDSLYSTNKTADNEGNFTELSVA